MGHLVTSNLEKAVQSKHLALMAALSDLGYFLAFWMGLSVVMEDESFTEFVVKMAYFIGYRVI